MPIAPPELLTLADALTRDTSEAAYRAAVSRAYYFCYHYSQDMAADLDHGGGKTLHEQLIRKFTEHPSNPVKTIGYQLRQFRDWRVDADYHLDKTIDKDTAAVAIQQAKQIQDAIDNLS